MKTNYKIALLLLSLSPISLLAAAGRTADGCTYKVINGQYLTDCSQRADEIKVRAPAPEEASETVVTTEASRPVPTSYDEVPVREKTTSNELRSTPSAPAIMPVPVSQPQNYNQEKTPREKAITAAVVKNSDVDLDDIGDNIDFGFGDQIYFGAMAGSTSFKDSPSGSTLGLSLGVGSNIDRNFSVELGYSYAKQGLNLGLASRKGGAINPYPVGSGVYSPNDASLSSNLLSLDFQWNFLGIANSFRPFFGFGLGWKSSTLQEIRSSQNMYSFSPNNAPVEEASLKQNSFGAIFSGGLKYRVNRNFLVVGSYRYFAPFARSAVAINNPNQYFSYNPAQGSSLGLGDAALAGSAQQQLMGGVQFLF